LATLTKYKFSPMNKILKPILFLFCAVAILACEKDRVVPVENTETGERPVVDYEIVQQTDPFTFEFKNKSSNYKTLEWRFGDDSLSREVSPTHMFLRDGRYEVVLTAISETGASARKLIVVNIEAEKVAKIVALPNGTPNTVKFTITSAAQIAAASWDFGDTTVSTQLQPDKLYKPERLYTAKVTVTTDKGAEATITKLVSSNGTLQEVTSQFILNAGPKFVASQRVGSRWGVVADWRVNQAVRQREGGMGGWDEWEGNSMSMEKWGGEQDIVNGKIEQTSLVPLPVGTYFYALLFHDFQVKDKLYNVISKANSLPDIDKVETDVDVIGRRQFSGNGPISSTTAFTITEPRTVTFGFVATFQQSDQNFKLTSIKLYRQDK
jgi:PKD repeat protein